MTVTFIFGIACLLFSVFRDLNIPRSFKRTDWFSTGFNVPTHPEAMSPAAKRCSSPQFTVNMSENDENVYHGLSCLQPKYIKLTLIEDIYHKNIHI